MLMHSQEAPCGRDLLLEVWAQEGVARGGGGHPRGGRSASRGENEVRAGWLFWREIGFFALIQLCPYPLEKSFEEEKAGPRGAIHESKWQPAVALS